MWESKRKFVWNGDIEEEREREEFPNIEENDDSSGFLISFYNETSTTVGCLMVADEDGTSVHVLACGKDGFGRDSQVAVDFRSQTAYTSFLDYNGGVDNMRHALGVFDLC